MIIELIYLFSGLLFMAGCWAIAKRNMIRPIRFLESNNQLLHQYLFSPASFLETTCGVVGSTISFYITIFTAFCLSFGWGSILICVLVPSAPVSFLLFYLLVRRVIAERFISADAMNQRTASESVTFMDYLLRHHGSWFGALFCVSLMVLYIIATVSTEMNSLQILYQHITRNPTDIIQLAKIRTEDLAPGQSDATYKFGLAILLCSLGYVLRGGYPGIMKIDVLQVTLIATVNLFGLGWILYAFHPFEVVRRQLLFSHHLFDIIALGVACLLLLITWISAALDNWLRVCGSMVDRIKDNNSAKSVALVRTMALKSLRNAMISATLLAMLISVVPAFLGLQLRENAIDLWQNRTVDWCASARAHAAPLLGSGPPAGSLEEYIAARYILVPTITCSAAITNGDWMAPSTRDSDELGNFTRFTSSVYDIFSLFLADRWVRFVEHGKNWEKAAWLAFSGLLSVSVICAVITTVNSYLLCTSQLAYRLVSLNPGTGNWFRQRTKESDGPARKFLYATGRWIVLPLGSTLLVALPIAYLVQSQILNEANYISYGILAFCNIVYLAMIAAISVIGNDAARVKRCIWWLFASWLVVILSWFVHMFAEVHDLPAALQSSVIGTWLAPRTSVVLLAAIANLAVWVGNYLVAPAVGRIRRRVTGRSGDG